MNLSKIVIAFVSLLFSCTITAQELILAKDGSSDYVIIADSNAQKLDRLAVKEFTTYFQKSTGVSLTEGNNDDDCKIFIGITPAAELILGAERLAALDEDESLIVTVGKDLFLVGGGRFGTVYAVYTFLENQLGIRWYDITGGEKVPPLRKLAISPLNYKNKPHFPYRMLVTSEYNRHPNACKFLFRNRINTIWGNFVNKEGAEDLDVRLTVNTPMGHTMFMYITADERSNPYNWKWQENKEYFKTNPEFFSMDRNGKRTNELQLCFSNKELRKEFTRRFKERIDLTKHNLYHIGGRDRPGHFCFCPDCQELEKKYSSVGGPLFDYILELSEEIKDSHPHVTIGISAYRKKQTEPPPALDKIPDNIYVKFCPIDDDTTKNYLHENNADTYKNLLRWNELSNNVWVWYYPCYGGSPSADFERTCADTLLMAKAGCIGMCFEHDYGVHAGLGFSDMMSWVLAQVYQRPDADWRNLVTEFAEFYYGKAAPLMLEYLFELQKIRTECEDFILYDGKVQLYYSDKQVANWQKMFDQMEQIASDEPLALAHVRDVRIDLDFLLLGRWSKFEESDFGFSAKDLHDRILRNIDSSLDRRFPNAKRIANHWRRPLVERLERNLLMTAKSSKPLPPEFDDIPAEKIQQTVPLSTSYAKSVPYEGAAFGFAMRDPKKRLELPFTMGFHDQFNKKSIVKMELTKDDIHIDKFHLYKMGTVTISQKCRLWLMQTWSAHVQLENFHRVGFPDKQWDLYVSLKFEGPGYGESQAEENNVWMDRVVLVEIE